MMNLLVNCYLSSYSYFWKNITLKILYWFKKLFLIIFQQSNFISLSYYKFKLLKILKIYFNLANLQNWFVYQGKYIQCLINYFMNFSY